MKTEKALELISKTWIVGRLFKTSSATITGAFYEFVYLFVWSILPFALGALVMYVTSEDPNKSFFLLSKNTFRNGELLVFTISMLAPILYLTLHDPESADPFPHKLPISTIVALIIVTSAALFALLKASAVKDVPFVFETSVVLTLVALVFRFLAIVYHKVRLPTVNEETLRANQNSFVDNFRTHIEKEQKTEKHNFTQSLAAHLQGEQA